MEDNLLSYDAILRVSLIAVQCFMAIMTGVCIGGYFMLKRIDIVLEEIKKWKK